jgi:hypothetical protein
MIVPIVLEPKNLLSIRLANTDRLGKYKVIQRCSDKNEAGREATDLLGTSR